MICLLKTHEDRTRLTREVTERLLGKVIEAVAVPRVPVVVPQATAPPGASDALVPGAKPTMVKSKGAVMPTVPGTRKTTASMASLLYLTLFAAMGSVDNSQH